MAKKVLGDVEVDALAEGYPKDFPKLLEAMTPTIQKIVRGLAHKAHQRDDLIQAGSLGLVDAVAKWVPSKGHFRAHAWWYIRNRICDEILLFRSALKRTNYQAQHFYLVKDEEADDLVYLDQDSGTRGGGHGGAGRPLHETIPDWGISPEEAVYAKEVQGLALRCARNDFESYVVKYVIMGGTTLEDAAAKWGVKRSAISTSVSKLQDRIRRKAA